MTESNRLKRNFISTMSHKIRAPLSAVLGFSDFLASEKAISEEDRRNSIERLRTNTALLTRLVTELLDVTEIDMADFTANRKKIILTEFMQKFYAAFINAFHEKNLKFQIQLRGHLPAIVESDPDQLNQIIKYVVENAINHTAAGLVKITVTSSRTLSGRQELAFIVSDSGTGMSAETKKRLFKPTENSLKKTKPSNGSDIGLNVARRMALGLGGDIRLASSNSHGTTFLITVDAGPIGSSHELIDQLTFSSSRASELIDNPHAFAGTKILVVDDSNDSSFLIGRILKDVGAQVQIVDRAQQGIETALIEGPDLILMDIEMPEMDGNEAIRRLREQGYYKPIVALSAHVMKEDQLAAECAGASDFLMKPVSRRSLIEAVERYTRIKEILPYSALTSVHNRS